MTKKTLEQRALEAMSEWGYEEKLKEAGFHDIEANSMRHRAAPGNPTRYPVFLDNMTRLAPTSYYVEGRETGEGSTLDSSNPAYHFHDSNVARYFQMARRIAGETRRQGGFWCRDWGNLDHVRYIRDRHAEGLSQRDIVLMAREDLGVCWGRHRVRSVVRQFKKEIQAALADESLQCYIERRRDDDE